MIITITMLLTLLVAALLLSLLVVYIATISYYVYIATTMNHDITMVIIIVHANAPSGARLPELHGTWLL